jgi:dTMP kinase
MDFRNKLIVFEGQDSTGKSSVATLLNTYLNKNNIPSVFTFQPGDTTYGTHAVLMRSMCKDKRYDLHPLANFFAFQLDRVEQTAKVVVPALEQGKTVISDRWNYSTYAYQLYGQQLIEKLDMPKQVAEWLLETAIISRKPDMVFYFPHKIVSNRKDDPNDNFDALGSEFFNRVHGAYEELAERFNWIRVTPGSSAEDTLNKILAME